MDPHADQLVVMAMRRERLAQAEARARLAELPRAKVTRRHSFGRLVIRLGVWIVGTRDPVLVWEINVAKLRLD